MGPDVPVLLAALLAGIVGSTHCAVMCGGIATGFSAMSTRQGWREALQLNLGRVGGYALAGALVGAFGGGLLALARHETAVLAMRVGVGLALVVLALRLLDQRGRLDFLARPGAAAGALWGWLPCGLSLSLLTVAWLQASARDAALTMAAFGLGTLPMMVALTWSGARLGRRWQQPAFRRIAAGFVLAAGLLTIASPWLMQHPALHGILAALGCRPLPA